MPASEAGSRICARSRSSSARPCAKQVRSRSRPFAARSAPGPRATIRPVSDADIAVDRFPARKTSARRHRLAFGGKRRTTASGSTASGFSSSIRSTGRDPISPGREDWSICAAVVERGRPVAAAIYVPVAARNVCRVGRLRRHPQRRPHRSHARARRSTGPASPVRSNVWIGSPSRSRGRREPKIHSLALRFARVARGQIDAAFASVNANDWDLAAADLLVHEAGGAMTGVSGEPLVYNLHASGARRGDRCRT